MKKRMYRKVHVKKVRPEELNALEEIVIVAVDVAKTDMVAALAGADGKVVRTVGWKSPWENELLLALLEQLRGEGKTVEVVLEPSGSYDDVLRHQLWRRGFSVFRVQGKRTHDAKEVHDGVPSLHDAKSAAILVKLHLDGVSRLWEQEDPTRRELKAAISRMDVHREHLQRLHGRLEAQLARYWPELCTVANLTTTTVLKLLSDVGGPIDVSAESGRAQRLMKRTSRGKMEPECIEAIVVSARRSIGVVPLPEERATLVELAAEALRSKKAFRKAERRVEELSDAFVPKELPPVIGRATSAVVIAETGDPSSYGSARAFMKACGLNLREKSSGKTQGRLRLTKRGSPRVRRYLWLATLRLLQTDDVVRAWYAKKVARDGGTKKKAVTALMRKLAKALYVVAAGEKFDSTKLFDVTRLKLA